MPKPKSKSQALSADECAALDEIVRNIRRGKTREFLVVVETPTGARYSIGIENCRRLAGWYYRSGGL